MRLAVKLLEDNLSDFYVKKNYDTDSGFDLYSIKDVTVEPWKVSTLEFGVSCSPFFRDNDKKITCGYYLYPRSSISKTPLMLANSVGIIDFGYCGPILAKVRNMSSDSYTVKKGTSLFQLCTPNLEPFEEIIFVDKLNSTERGDGGFGSTNKN